MACAESSGIVLHVSVNIVVLLAAIFALFSSSSRPQPQMRPDPRDVEAAANDPSECRSASRRLEPAVPFCTANATCANCRTAAGPATATWHELLSASVECRSSWVECRSASSPATYAIHEARICAEKEGASVIEGRSPGYVWPAKVEYRDSSEQAWWKGLRPEQGRPCTYHRRRDHQCTGAFSRDEGTRTLRTSGTTWIATSRRTCVTSSSRAWTASTYGCIQRRQATARQCTTTCTTGCCQARRATSSSSLALPVPNRLEQPSTRAPSGSKTTSVAARLSSGWVA